MTASSRRLHVVVPRGASLGFALAGVSVEELEPALAREALRERLADPGVGVLAVESSLVAAIPAESRARAAREGLPLILPFTWPRAFLEEGHGEEYVAALIREAIGYHIKVGGLP